MLSDLIRAAAQGEALWVPDLRAAFASGPDTAKLILRLRLIHGEVRDYPLCLPRWSTSEEQRFVAEFLYANIYNLLSVCSGRELCLYYDQKNEDLTTLVQTLEDVFQIHQSHRHGYGKVINIADRLCAAEGYAPFRFSVAALQDYGPARHKPDEATDGSLAIRLQHLC